MSHNHGITPLRPRYPLSRITGALATARGVPTRCTARLAAPTRNRHRRRLSVAVAAVSCVLAISTCGLSGSPSSAAETGRGDALALKFANCMRSHGVPNFPDPTFLSSAGTSVNLTGLNPQSPRSNRHRPRAPCPRVRDERWQREHQHLPRHRLLRCQRRSRHEPSSSTICSDADTVGRACHRSQDSATTNHQVASSIVARAI